MKNFCVLSVLFLLCSGLWAWEFVNTDQEYSKFIKPDISFENTVFNSDSQLNIFLHPKIDMAEAQNIKETLTLNLCRKNYVVKEWEAPCIVITQKDGEFLEINVNTELYYDLPSGEYYITSPSLGNYPLAKFQVKGLYNSPVKKSPTADNLNIVSKNEPKAGKDWKFDFSYTSSVKSDKLILLFEKEKDVSYYGTVLPIKNSQCELKCKLPKTLPDGEYKVRMFLNNDIIKGVKDVYTLPFTTINIKSDYTEETTDLKPISYGLYRDCTGFCHLWHGNQAGTMFWNGEMWMPMSGMYVGPYTGDRTRKDKREHIKEIWQEFVKNMDVLESRGIKHVYLYTHVSMQYVDPFCWEFIMDYLEQRGFTYTIGFPQGKPGAEYYLESRAIRASKDFLVMDKDKTGVYEKYLEPTDFEPCGDDGIMQVDYLVTDKDMNPIKMKNAPILTTEESCPKTVKVDLSEFNEPVNVIYSAKVQGSRAVGNTWAARDYQPKFVTDFIQGMEMRPGFRGFVDMILPNERGFRPGENMFISTPEFLSERGEKLKEKYQTCENVKNAWEVIGDFPTDFAQIAQLYPVYNTGEYIIIADDSNNMFKIKSTSPYWTEYIEMRDKSYEEVQNYVVCKVKEKIDVPIFIKGVCFREIYGSNFNKSRLGIDATGCELYHRGEAITDFGMGYRYAEKLVSKKALIEATTEMNSNAMDSMYPNYNNINSFFYDMSMTHFFGNKITYLFLLDIYPDNLFEKNRIIRDERMLEWMRIWSDILQDKKDKIENFQPYVYCSWPKCESWEANPSSKTSLQPKSDAFGARCVKAPNGVWVLNSIYPFESDYTFVTLHDKPATTYFKDDFEKLRKETKIVMLGLRKDLGSLSVDEYYKNEFFEDEDYTYQALNVPKGAKITQEKDGKVWGMIVGDLQIVACEPKFCDSIEDVIAFAKLPKVKNDAKLNTDNYMKDILNIEFATYGNDKYKAVGTNLKGKPVSIIHTTDEKGLDSITLFATHDCIVEQNLSPKNGGIADETGRTYTTKKVKKGEKLKITFPAKKDNPHVGAGMGTVKIIGIPLKDLQFENIEKDTSKAKSYSKMEKSVIPEGMEFIMPGKVKAISVTNMEGQRALAAYNKAIDLYNIGKPLRCEELLREYIGIAPAELYGKYSLVLGNLQLLKGSPIDAKNYLEAYALEHPEDKDVQVSYGIYLYSINEKEKAKEIWTNANTPQALNNLKLAL